MTTRKRVNELAYLNFRKKKENNECDFCKFQLSDGQTLKEYGAFWIVKNIFKYDLWDNQDVEDHLMLVPKEHTSSLSELSTKSLNEYAKILAKYDKIGYSLYARTDQNKAKSISHQHTHLIKLGTHQKKLKLFLRSPYILWYR